MAKERGGTPTGGKEGGEWRTAVGRLAEERVGQRGGVTAAGGLGRRAGGAGGLAKTRVRRGVTSLPAGGNNIQCQVIYMRHKQVRVRTGVAQHFWTLVGFSLVGWF